MNLVCNNNQLTCTLQCVWCGAYFCENCFHSYKSILGVVGDRNLNNDPFWAHFGFVPTSSWRYGRLRVCGLCAVWRSQFPTWDAAKQLFQETLSKQVYVNYGHTVFKNSNNLELGKNCCNS